MLPGLLMADEAALVEGVDESFQGSSSMVTEPSEKAKCRNLLVSQEVSERGDAHASSAKNSAVSQ